MGKAKTSCTDCTEGVELSRLDAALVLQLPPLGGTSLLALDAYRDYLRLRSNDCEIGG
jgi:hypothetical protein